MFAKPVDLNLQLGAESVSEGNFLRSAKGRLNLGERGAAGLPPPGLQGLIAPDFGHQAARGVALGPTTTAKETQCRWPRTPGPRSSSERRKRGGLLLLAGPNTSWLHAQPCHQAARAARCPPEETAHRDRHPKQGNGGLLLMVKPQSARGRLVARVPNPQQGGRRRTAPCPCSTGPRHDRWRSRTVPMSPSPFAERLEACRSSQRGQSSMCFGFTSAD